MPHWHDFNPWSSTLRYITRAQAMEVLDKTSLDGTSGERQLAQYGNLLDFYIIPYGVGCYSFGIRYGKEKFDYLSPHITAEQGDKIMKELKSVLEPEVFTLTFTKEEAQRLSLELSDLLCWHRGFAAAREGTLIESNGPLGVDAVRTINIKLQRSF